MRAVLGMILLLVVLLACGDATGPSPGAVGAWLVDGQWHVRLPSGGECWFPYLEPERDSVEEAIHFCRVITGVL